MTNSRNFLVLGPEQCRFYRKNWLACEVGLGKWVIRYMKHAAANDCGSWQRYKAPTGVEMIYTYKQLKGLKLGVRKLNPKELGDLMIDLL